MIDQVDRINGMLAASGGEYAVHNRVLANHCFACTSGSIRELEVDTSTGEQVRGLVVFGEPVVLLVWVWRKLGPPFFRWTPILVDLVAGFIVCALFDPDNRLARVITNDFDVRLNLM